MPHDKRKKAARAIQVETGLNYTRALREADRRYAEQQAAKKTELSNNKLINSLENESNENDA